MNAARQPLVGLHEIFFVVGQHGMRACDSFLLCTRRCGDVYGVVISGVMISGVVISVVVISSR